MNLCEQLLPEIWILILQNLLDVYHFTLKHARIVFAIRKLSLFFKHIVEIHLLPEIGHLSMDVEGRITVKELRFFRSLKNVRFYHYPNDLRQLTWLTSIHLGTKKPKPNDYIKNIGIETLVNLKQISITSPLSWQLIELSSLTNLKSLSLFNSTEVKDDAIGFLTQLQSLELDCDYAITGSCFEHLTRLKELHLSGPYNGSGDLLSYISSRLTHLHLRNFSAIHYAVFDQMTNLTELSISFCVFTDDTLTRLTNLVKFSNVGRIFITDQGLSKLSHLKSLYIDDMYSTPNITLQGIKHLKENLEEIILSSCDKIKANDLLLFTSLKRIRYTSPRISVQDYVIFGLLERKGIDVTVDEIEYDEI